MNFIHRISFIISFCTDADMSARQLCSTSSAKIRLPFSILLNWSDIVMVDTKKVSTITFCYVKIKKRNWKEWKKERMKNLTHVIKKRAAELLNKQPLKLPNNNSQWAMNLTTWRLGNIILEFLAISEIKTPPKSVFSSKVKIQWIFTIFSWFLWKFEYNRV